MTAINMNKTVPGVYIQEIDAVRPISGVSTGVCGFVGIAGPGATEYDGEPTLVTSWNDYTAKYGRFAFGSFLGCAVYQFFAQGGTTCYVVSLPPPAGAAAASIAITGLGTLTAKTLGTWANALSIQVGNSPDGPTPTAGYTLSLVYTLGAAAKGYDFWGTLLLGFARVNGIKPTIVRNKKGDIVSQSYVLESYPGLVGSRATDAAKRINGQSLFLSLQPDPAPQRPTNTTAPVALKGGADGLYNFAAPASAGVAAQGIYAFEQLEDNVINFVAMPDLVTSSIDKQQGTIAEAINFVDGMGLTPPRETGSLFYVADVPLGLAVQDVLSFKNGEKLFNASAVGQPITSAYCALYYPWMVMNDPASQANLLIPPSGAVAGTYAATDARRGVYKAPAGIDDGKLALAVGLELSINENQQSVLNPQGINAIRDLPSFGICIWGARTASLDPAWQYINVRRTMIYLEQSVKAGTWWVVFEPNTSNLWAKVERNISVFLKQFWQAGGLFGLSEKDAFYVKCDASNNPPEQRELGYLVVEIGVAIVRPAEFVILQFTQMTQQS